MRDHGDLRFDREVAGSRLKRAREARANCPIELDGGEQLGHRLGFRAAAFRQRDDARIQGARAVRADISGYGVTHEIDAAAVGAVEW